MKSENKRWEEWMRKGEEAFHAGKTKEAIDEAGLYNLGARNAWLIGWRNAGGDILVPGHCLQRQSAGEEKL